jgi:hypothetical protein
MPSQLLPDEISIHVEPIDIHIGAKWHVKKEPSGYISEWSIGSYSTKGHIMATTIPSGQTGDARVTWTDAQDNSTVSQWPTWWESSDTAIVTVDASPTDGLMAKVTSVGPIGAAQVRAHTGENSEIHATPLDVEVVGGAAVAGTIEFTLRSEADARR